MNYKKILGVFIFSSLVIAGCKSQYEELLTSGDSDAKYAAAFDYYVIWRACRDVDSFQESFRLSRKTLLTVSDSS